MKPWVIAAAAFIPAVALATPITFTTASGKTVTVKVKEKSKNTGAGSTTTTPAASTDRSGLGNALASDVTLGGISASSLVYGAGINPQQGANGNTSGFAGAYAGSGSGDWDSLVKFSGTGNLGAASSLLSGLTLTMGFGLTDMRHGTWSITNTNQSNNLSLDLVFAMHTGGGSGSWLFDNYVLGAGSTAQGTWALNLLNNGGQLADYSNLTLFARNAVATPLPVAASPAPTPAPAPTPVLEELATVIPPITAGGGATSEGAPAAGTSETLAGGGASASEPPSAPAPTTGTSPDNGGVVIQIPIGELLDELVKHGPIEPGTEIEIGGLFGDSPAADVPEPAPLVVFLTGLAMFGASLRQRKRRGARNAA